LPIEKNEERKKKDNVPDGTEKVLEWREGPHKVVERRVDAIFFVSPEAYAFLIT
jgi:hypothetical protein